MMEELSKSKISIHEKKTLITFLGKNLHCLLFDAMHVNLLIYVGFRYERASFQATFLKLSCADTGIVGSDLCFIQSGQCVMDALCIVNNQQK